jgi:hypothetical protein
VRNRIWMNHSTRKSPLYCLRISRSGRRRTAAAFLVSGIAGSTPGLVGEAYVDGSGNRYLPMLRQPILIYAADNDLVGIALRADRKIVDKLRPHS